MSGDAQRTFGHSPPAIDLMIGAVAIEHELYLVFRNVREARYRRDSAQPFEEWSGDVPIEAATETIEASVVQSSR